MRECRKVLINPNDVLVGDANTAWLSHEAVKVCNALRDLDVYIEQPCESMEECLRVRALSSILYNLFRQINTRKSEK